VNVRFVGVSARQLRLLLKDVVRPSSSGSRRSPRPVQSTVTTVQKTPAVQTFRNDQRLQTSDVARRAYSPAKGPSSVAHVSPDDVDFDRYEQEEIAFGDFSTGEVNATTRLFSDGMAFRATTTTAHSDTPFAAVRSRIEPSFFRIGDR
jgi:hypothetical protein